MPGVERALPACPPRLSDWVAIGVLTRSYPPALVDRVLAECGRVEQRHRLLPARLVVDYVLALALFAGWPMRRCCAAWSRAAGSVVVAQPAGAVADLAHPSQIRAGPGPGPARGGAPAGAV
jgi:Insertion element 4 transposase N-terminal